MKQSQRSISIAVAIALATICAGCGSAKKASESNFTKTLNDYHAENCISITPTLEGFPHTVELLPEGNQWAAEQNPKRTQRLDVLLNAGLLTVTNQVLPAEENMYNSKPERPAKVYALTKKGEKALTTVERRSLLRRSSRDGFCIAKHTVDEIDSFSAPSEMMGYTVSNVSYTVSPTEVARWAKNAEVVQAFPGIESVLAKSQTKSATLVLMNDGWAHEANAM